MNMKQNYMKAGRVLSSLFRNAKINFLAILAIAGIGIAVTLSHADSDGNQSERGLAGTWIANNGGGLLSFMSDGRMMGSIPVNILVGNGPNGEGELAAGGHGEWIRIGNREFATTMFDQLSHPSVGFTHLIKGTGNYTLNKAGDELTLTEPTVTVYFPDGTKQFGPFPGEVTHYKRVIVGQ
jgi:hypothetical protein